MHFCPEATKANPVIRPLSVSYRITNSPATMVEPSGQLVVRLTPMYPMSNITLAAALGLFSVVTEVLPFALPFEVFELAANESDEIATNANNNEILFILDKFTS